MIVAACVTLANSADTRAVAGPAGAPGEISFNDAATVTGIRRLEPYGNRRGSAPSF